MNLGVPLGCLCQGPLLPGLCPSSEGQGDLFCPCFLRIQLDMCTPVERTKEGRSYASVGDHLELQSKAENCKGQGLPKKPSGRSASHAAWLITPVPLALQSGGKTSSTAMVQDVLSTRRKLQQHRSAPTTLCTDQRPKPKLEEEPSRSRGGRTNVRHEFVDYLCWKRGVGSDQCL